MQSTRRTFLAGTSAFAAASTLSFPAFAQDELKLATFVPPSHPIPHQVFTAWFPEVEKQSGGKLKIKLFPSMQLGGKPPELYRQMIQGVSDICFTLPGYTSNDFPRMALTELPGLSSTGEKGTRNLWAALDKYLAPEFKGAKVLMLWNNDEAALMSKSKPIRTLDDMKGMKIRTPSAAQSAQLDALGAVPIDMPANQIYNALDRGVVDATMIPVSGAIDFKLIEVARYFTLNAPLGRSPFLVAMNQARYDKLGADEKKGNRQHHRPWPQPERDRDLRGAGPHGGRTDQKGSRTDHAVGRRAQALARCIQAADCEQGRGSREDRNSGQGPARRLWYDGISRSA